MASQLTLAGMQVAIVNPRQVRDFAKALGKLVKTDAVDAHVRALFAERMRPESRPMPDASNGGVGRAADPPSPARRSADGGAKSSAADALCGGSSGPSAAHHVA